jgi:hypothetical protein
MLNNELDDRLSFDLFAPSTSDPSQSEVSNGREEDKKNKSFTLWSKCIQEQKHERKKELIDATSGWKACREVQKQANHPNLDGIPVRILKTEQSDVKKSFKKNNDKKIKEIEETVAILSKDLKEKRKDILCKHFVHSI